MMRILSVTTGIPSDGADWVRIGAMAGMLKSRGHKVDMVCYQRKKSLGSHADIQLPPIEHVVASIPRAGFDLLQRLARDRYDLVYANLFTAGLISTASRIPRVPFVLDMHGDAVAEYALLQADRFGPFRFWVGAAKYSLTDYFEVLLADRVICVSREMMNRIQSRGIPNKRTSYVTNGIDLNFYRPAADTNTQEAMKKKLGLEGKFVFGYVGTPWKYQGVESLMEAARSLKDDDIIVLIVGGTSRVTERNLLVRPRVSKVEAREYYVLCDVLVLPRPSSAVTDVAAPTKFAEYVGMGKPVLVTKVGDAANLTREYSCGVVVQNNRPELLADGMRAMRSMSPSDLAKMGANSRRLAEAEFDWEKIAPKLWETIETA